jgi:membrane-associated phospholipid phosphatase
VTAGRGFPLIRRERLPIWTDNAFVVYLWVTAGLIVAFRDSVDSWGALVVAHGVGAVAVGRLRRLTVTLSPVLELLRYGYPILLFPLLYKEVEVLAADFGDWGLTESIRHLEVTLFGGHPSMALSELLPWWPLSEYLHLCYISHIVLLPALAGTWYHGYRAAFYELLFLVTVTLSTSYFFFILFPVDSPFYLAPALKEPLSNHFFYKLVHYIADRGGARGGAFPSTHVSLTTVLWLTAWSRQRPIALWSSPVVAGLIVATVYGRFHYALDVIAGLALAVAVVCIYKFSLKTPPDPER